MGGAEFQVKGSSIRSKIDFARDRLSSEAARQLEEYLRARGVYPVLDANWYPFALYDDLLHEIARRHLGGDLSRLTEVGGYSAERSLGTTYDTYAQGGDFGRFLARISALHSRFYSAGRLKVRSSEEGACELEIVGAPVISEADMQVAAGFYIGAARFLGLENVRCRFSIESDRVRFRLRW